MPSTSSNCQRWPLWPILSIPPLALSAIYLYSRLHPSPSTSPINLRYLISRQGSTRLPSSDRMFNWVEYGPEDAPVLLYFHGNPGGKVVPIPDLRSFCDANHVKVILLERDVQAFGSVDASHTSTVLSYAADVKEFLDMRNMNQEISIAAFSEGVPYALAFLSLLPPDPLKSIEIANVYLISSIGFYSVQDSTLNMSAPTRAMHFLAKWMPSFALRSYFNLLSPASDMPRYIASTYHGLPRIEQEKVGGYWAELYKANVCEQFKNGTDFYADEISRTHGATAPDGWGFDVRLVGTKNVPITFYHGELDHISTIKSARHLYDCLQSAGADAKLVTVGDGGHWSTLDIGLKEAIRHTGESGVPARASSPQEYRSRKASSALRRTQSPLSVSPSPTPTSTTHSLRAFSPASHFVPVAHTPSRQQQTPSPQHQPKATTAPTEADRQTSSFVTARAPSTSK